MNDEIKDTEQYFKKHWFFNVSFDNLRSEGLRRMQTRLVKDVFLHSVISIVMFVGSFSDLLCDNPFTLRLMALGAGMNLAFSFHQFFNWNFGRLEEKAMRNLEDDYKSRMKAKDRVLEDLMKERCRNEPLP